MDQNQQSSALSDNEKSVNDTRFIGNLVSDFEVNTLSNGDRVVNATIAINNSRKSKNPDKVRYADLAFWNELADELEVSGKKGTRIAIKGAMDQNTFETKDGRKVRATFYRVQKFSIEARGV
jgi:single stranded DNA-binding protein